METKTLYIDDLLYARFRENGAGPDEFNCWNLCREIYRRAGRALPAYHEYISKLSRRDRFINAVKAADFEPAAEPGFLDIVTLRLKGRLVTHVGCMLDKRRFIHISKKCGVSVTGINDRKWKDKIEGIYRYNHGRL